MIFQASLSEFMFFVFWVMCHSHLDLEEDNEHSSATFQVAKLGGLPSSILYFPNFLLMKISLIIRTGWQYNYNIKNLYFTSRWCGKIFFYFRKVNLELILNWVENKKISKNFWVGKWNTYGRIQFCSVELKPTWTLTKAPLFPVRFLFRFPGYR